MEHDEKLTVPPTMYTPPPCKHKRETRENPIGAMGTFEGPVARTDCSLQNCRSQLRKRESKQAREQFSHRGDGKF